MEDSEVLELSDTIIMEKNNDILIYEEKLRSHRIDVHTLLNKVITILNERGINHDISKYSKEEREIFQSIVFTDVEYGTDAYYNRLNLLKTATDHHYKINSHHPEYYKNGIKDMNLIDIIEMLCDWISAAKNYNKVGDVYKSIDIGQQRFGYDNILKNIFLNTIKLLG